VEHDEVGLSGRKKGVDVLERNDDASVSWDLRSEEIVKAVDACDEDVEKDLNLEGVTGSSRYVDPVIFEPAVLGLAVS
jgi:hypothetical protein